MLAERYGMTANVMPPLGENCQKSEKEGWLVTFRLRQCFVSFCFSHFSLLFIFSRRLTLCWENWETQDVIRSKLSNC